MIAGFLSAVEVTEIRGKLSGRMLAWSYQDYPKTMKKLRATGLRIDWVRLHYMRPGQHELWGRERSTTLRAGLGNNQIARLVVPIQTSGGVVFTSQPDKGEQLVRRFPTGVLSYVDQRHINGVENQDPKLTSIHLMIDAYGSDDLRKLVHLSGLHAGREAATTV